MKIRSFKTVSLVMALALLILLRACGNQIRALDKGEEGRYFNINYEQMGGFFTSLNEQDNSSMKHAKTSLAA